VILKSYIVEQNLEVLNDYQAVLLYGENDGLKDDIKYKLKILNQNSEIISIFESEIIKNKKILYENIINESLFNEKKIIFIQLATDKILNEIFESLEKNNKNAKIYIFSGNLDKKSKLRNAFEKEKKIAIFPCYPDNERTLINYINKKLENFKGVTGELISIIITNSSSNRKIIQNEIVKIKSFFSNKEITKAQLLKILNIKNDTGFEEIRDAALMGRRDKTNKLLSEIDILNEDSFYYLNNLNYRILKLIEIQNSNKVFNNYEKTLENIKPPIFWKDKPIYLQQVKKWNLEKLNKIANEIGNVELLMKKNSLIKNDVVVKNLIITLSKEASISS
jgi:DNA polymerase-3 subunit delta|tara:strand:+ start:627 stop:1631 length:1005 start_codon:yes stop_codon:yes gene_type:complete